MANPTTNFGWVMPTATDLVTSLPADFDVFGQAVDTDFIGLKGGTTGQVLAKASATDLDFVWSADAAGMTNPMTTTGDIIYSSPGSTPARLGIGSAADVLTVDGSGVPTWSAPAGGGGMTLLSTTNLSGGSTTISSISGAYKTLFALITNVNAGASYHLQIAPNNDTVTSFGNAVVGVSGTVTNNHLQYTYIKTQGTGMDGSNVMVLQIENYASTSSAKPVSFYGLIKGGNGVTYNYFGAWMQNAALTSLVFSPTVGTFSAGTVLLYGVN
tara:strand:- start:443 stop:1252 length:810 start_codon:yes stop_codon:yes gene_type:complete